MSPTTWTHRVSRESGYQGGPVEGRALINKELGLIGFVLPASAKSFIFIILYYS